jgi:hypothetical protein
MGTNGGTDFATDHDGARSRLAPVTRGVLAVLVPLVVAAAALSLGCDGYLDWYELPYLLANLAPIEYNPEQAPQIVMVLQDWTLADLTDEQLRTLLDAAGAKSLPEKGTPEARRLLLERLGNSEVEATRAAVAGVVNRLDGLAERAAVVGLPGPEGDLPQRPAVVAIDMQFDPEHSPAADGTATLCRTLAGHDDGSSGPPRLVPVVLSVGPSLTIEHLEPSSGPPGTIAELYSRVLRPGDAPLCRSVTLGSTLVARSCGFSDLVRKEVFLFTTVAAPLAPGTEPGLGLGVQAYAVALGLQPEGQTTWGNLSGLDEVRLVPATSGGETVRIPVKYACDPSGCGGVATTHTILRFSETERGVPDPFPTLSMWPILRNEISREDCRRLAGSIVFVGDTTSGDEFPVPGKRHASGVSLHAHVANMVKTGQFVRFMPVGTQLLLCWLLGVVLCWGVLSRGWKTPWKQVIAIATFVSLLSCALLRVVTFVFTLGLAVVVSAGLCRYAQDRYIRWRERAGAKGTHTTKGAEQP